LARPVFLATVAAALIHLVAEALVTFLKRSLVVADLGVNANNLARLADKI
jgi:hypothetical protein